MVRECIRTIQQFRKDSGLEISDLSHLQLSTTDADVLAALNAFSTKIGEEVLAKQIDVESIEPSGTVADINGVSLGLLLR